MGHTKNASIAWKWTIREDGFRVGIRETVGFPLHALESV